MATILAVDDRPINRKLLLTLLGFQGHRVVEASDGREALERIHDHRPDLVITDILMPTMDGLELVRKLREDPATRDLPVIFYTATYRVPEAEALGQGLAVKRVLPKPCEPATILAAVEAALVNGSAAPAAPPPAPPVEPGAEPPPVDQAVRERLDLLDRGLVTYLEDVRMVSRELIRISERGPELMLQRDHLARLSDQLVTSLPQLQSVSLRLAALVENGPELLAEREPAALLEGFCRLAQQVVGARHAVLAVWGKGVRHFATRGLSQAAREGLEQLDPETGLLGKVAVERRPVRLSEQPGDPVAVGLPPSYPPVHCLIAVPVATQTIRYGWLCLTEPLTGEPFNGDDERLALTLAAQAAVAYDNLGLFGQAERHRQELEREVAERRSVQAALAERTHLAELHKQIAKTMLEATSLRSSLQCCAEGLVQHFDAAFARVWTLGSDGQTLELQASAGLYTHLDGPHSRVPLGKLKIGRIAERREPHLTNHVLGDPQVNDQEWARRERMVAFAGYPLVLGDRLLGVIALFARHILTDFVLQGMASIAGDVAVVVERRRSEEARHLLEEQLLHAQKMEAVGRLAGGVAHDFNNLLTVILGYGGALGAKVAHDPEAARDLEQMLLAGERAVTLTRQLLAFSRREVLQPRLLDVNAVVRDIEGMLRRLIGEDVELATALAVDAGTVSADPGQIEQVLFNLAINARDAMPDGGRLTIETAAVELDAGPDVKPGGYVKIAVTDTGLGIEPAILRHIFEPFFTTKELSKGTGLGLATCYGIVRQSGGHISVSSHPGQGAVFEILLPRIEAPAPAAAAAAAAGAPLPRGSETVLLVEDEEMLRQLARAILEGQGYTVLDAPSGAAALEVAGTAGTIDLLLTDVVMPGMSGPDLARKVRALRPEIHVLLMSGYADDAVVRHGVVEPGTNFLQKPFTAVNLTRRVREVLDG